MHAGPESVIFFRYLNIYQWNQRVSFDGNTQIIFENSIPDNSIHPQNFADLDLVWYFSKKEVEVIHKQVHDLLFVFY